MHPCALVKQVMVIEEGNHDEDRDNDEDKDDDDDDDSNGD